jgi:acyl-CoA synthetase (AMP-forming)/AMP-acid ligase II
MLTGEILARSAARLPDKAALLWDGGSMTYQTLDEAANRFAHALIGAGVGAGDTVAVLCGNRTEYPIAYFGIARTGAISAHMSPRYLEDEIRHTLALVGTRIAVVEAPLDQIVSAMMADLPKLESLIVVGDGGNFETFMANQPTSDPDVEIDLDAPASITFTGGTTGMPKAALLTHRGRSHWGKVAINDFGLDEDEIGMVAAPLYHAAGGFIWFAPTLMAGGSAVIQGHWDVADFIAGVERHSGTGAFLVPAQISMLLEHPAFDAARLKTLRKIMFGAAPASPALIARAEAALPHVHFIQNFGQSETGPLITTHRADRQRKPETIGRPSPLVEVGIFTAPGKPAAPGEIGQICARGVHVMQGYVNDAAETAEFFHGGDDGWGWTGDLAFADEEGLITLVDRAKDMIISGGVNVYPAEIERVLDPHPEIVECAVFGIADERWGELPAIAIVRTEGSGLTADDITAYCNGRIARHKRPRRIEFMDVLPRSAAGKVLRTVLREQFDASNVGVSK